MENETLFVLAKDESQFYLWHRFGRKTGQAACFVESHKTVRGFRLDPDRVIALKGWEQNRYASAIREALKHAGVDPDRVTVKENYRWSR